MGTHHSGVRNSGIGYTKLKRTSNSLRNVMNIHKLLFKDKEQIERSENWSKIRCVCYRLGTKIMGKIILSLSNEGLQNILYMWLEYAMQATKISHQSNCTKLLAFYYPSKMVRSLRDLMSKGICLSVPLHINFIVAIKLSSLFNNS